MVGANRMRCLWSTWSTATTGELDDGVEVGLHNQRDLEDRLAVRLVEAREGRAWRPPTRTGSSPWSGSRRANPVYVDR